MPIPENQLSLQNNKDSFLHLFTSYSQLKRWLPHHGSPSPVRPANLLATKMWKLRSPWGWALTYHKHIPTARQGRVQKPRQKKAEPFQYCCWAHTSIFPGITFTFLQWCLKDRWDLDKLCAQFWQGKDRVLDEKIGDSQRYNVLGRSYCSC